MAKLNRREQTKLNYMQNGGNMKQAMIDAGYSETYADRNSQYLMGIIGEDIKNEQKNIKSEKIKDVTQIQERWSEWMDSDELTYAEKIRVSELLAKSQGGFIEKKTKQDKEEQQARIDKLKAETARIKGEEPDGNTPDDGFIDALQGQVAEIWQE